MFRTAHLQSISNQLKGSESTTADSPAVFNYQENVCNFLFNSPKSLNALHHQIIRMLNQEVDKWNNNPDLKAVIFKGAGGKAFCAGGDIKSLYAVKRSGKDPENFLDAYNRDIYTLAYRLAGMKPYQIAIWDGIVFGGGVGLSFYAPIKIATEKSLLAVPEAKLGFFTNACAGHYLPRLSHNLGMYLGLTGSRLKGAEVVQAGLANYYVKSENIPKLEKDLNENINKNTDLAAIKAIVSKYSEKVDQPFKNVKWIEKIFGQDSVENIIKALKEAKENKELAYALLQQMESSSPLSLKLIFEQIKTGKYRDLREDMKVDMRITERFMESKEFSEGVRCTLVDRNDKPNWTYKTVEEVPKEAVEKFFEPIKNELLL